MKMMNELFYNSFLMSLKSSVTFVPKTRVILDSLRGHA